MKRVDYQDLNGDLEAVNERRNAEIRAWANESIATADAHLLGDHVTTIDDWDLAPEPTEPQEEPQPVDNPVEDTGTAADDTVAQADEDKKAAAEAEPESEKPAPAKKVPAKKAAAPAKEAPSKE